MSGEFNEGLYRFSGIYGAALNSKGEILSDVVEVSGAVEVGRIEMPLVGTTRQGHKRGRETRDGTMRLQKIDTKWEMRVYNLLSQSLTDRRRDRDQGHPTLEPFTLLIDLDDPDALGHEQWRLEGCIAEWRLPLGFAITDDIIEREYPLTWESESPVYAFRARQKPVEHGGTRLAPDWFSKGDQLLKPASVTVPAVLPQFSDDDSI